MDSFISRSTRKRGGSSQASSSLAGKASAVPQKRVSVDMDKGEVKYSVVED